MVMQAHHIFEIQLRGGPSSVTSFLASNPERLSLCEIRNLLCRLFRILFSLFATQMAEKEGFEPPVPFPAQLISSQPRSATPALLLI